MIPYSGGPGSRKRAHSPAAEQRPQRWPATSALQDPQIAQATQGFGDLGLVSNSPAQDQHYNKYILPRPPVPTYGMTPDIQAGQLDAFETKKLWDAVASGSTFRSIKENLFHDRFDITTGILKDHAERLGACWTAPEDWALLHSGITEFASRDDLVHIRGRLRGYISPSRSIDDIYARFKHLMAKAKEDNLRDPPGRGPSQDEGQSVYDPMPYVSASPTANLDYPAPGPSSVGSGSVTQTLGGASSWSAQHHGVPSTVLEAFPGHELQDDNVPHMVPETFLGSEFDDSDDSQIESPEFSDTEWQHDDGLPRMPPESFIGDEREDFEEPNMGPQNPYNTEREYGYDHQMSPQAFLSSEWEYHGDPQMSPQAFLDTESQDYDVRQEATQPFSNSGLNHDDTPQAMPQISLEDRSGGQEHVDNYADRGGRSGHSPPTPEILEDIKLKSAEGLSIPEIHQEFYPDCSYWKIQNALLSKGWKTWTKDENEEVLYLHLHGGFGDNWDQISRNMRLGVQRSGKEVEARVKLLKQSQTVGMLQSRHAQRHKYTSEDNKYIRHQLAQHTPYHQMKMERFPHVTLKSLQNHARHIGASWGPRNVDRLTAAVQQSQLRGVEVDWDSVAAEFDPPRDGEIVKKHWRYLNRRQTEQPWDE